MNKIVCYYFSGTGNTEYLTRIIRNRFQNKNIPCDVLPVDFLDSIDLSIYDLAFFLYPVYAFGEPVPFSNFIQKLPHVSGTKAFVFCSMAGISGGIEYITAKKLKAKGFDVLGAHHIRMWSNSYAGKFPKENEIQKNLPEAEAKVAEIIEMITQDNRFRIKNPILSYYLAGKWVYKGFKKFSKTYMQKKALVTDRCTACGICAKACPTRNIHIKQRKAEYGSNCISCMRCFNFCPENAIDYAGSSVNSPRFRGPLSDYRFPIAHS